MKTTTVSLGQTLTDIALQEYGCVEGLIDLMKLNPDLEINGKLIPGTDVNLPDVVPVLTPSNIANLNEIKRSFKRANTGTGDVLVSEYYEPGYIDPDYIV